MAPSIDLSKETFERLQKLAEPFVDSPDTVIQRLLDNQGITEAPAAESGERIIGKSGSAKDAINLNPNTPPHFKHSNLTFARFGKVVLDRAKWNNLVEESLRQAAHHFGSFEALRRNTICNIRPGKYEERGFRYVREPDLSFQGQDANDSYRVAIELARKMSVELEIELFWHDKPEVEYPGRSAKLAFEPKT